LEEDSGAEDVAVVGLVIRQMVVPQWMSQLCKEC